MATPAANKPIGVLLQENGLITKSYIDMALQEKAVTNEKIGEILVRLGLVSQYDVAIVLSEQKNLPFVDVDNEVPDKAVLRLFNLNLCLKNFFLPLRQHKPGMILIASAADDTDELGMRITRITGLQPEFRQGEKGKIENAVQHYYYFLDNPVERLLETEVRLLSADRDGMRSMDPFIENLLQLAVKNRTSDIHIRPMDRTISVAFRVDGVIRAQFSLPGSFKRLVSVLKIKSNMDIAEQRLPQDGGFSATILNNPYDMRVSTTITPYGENLVMRMLQSKGDLMGMRQLGVFEEDVKEINRIFSAPYGIVLLTGPTGSGKTTTLYAAVRAMNLAEKNIMTVENPIEYRVPLIRQTQINTKSGYTFASAIRFFLRHDPDVILVGEIRDKETAETAISASETGHLVLSTLHTNTAIGAIPRLRSLDIPPFMVADALVGVVSQRLVRRICPLCKEEYTPDEEELRYLRDPGIKTLFRGRGCESCGDSGYHGRSLVYEILRIDRKLAAEIGRDVQVDALKEIAVANGFKDIFTNAIEKVKRGEIAVKEMVRVLGHY